MTEEELDAAMDCTIYLSQFFDHKTIRKLDETLEARGRPRAIDMLMRLQDILGPHLLKARGNQ